MDNARVDLPNVATPTLTRLQAGEPVIRKAPMSTFLQSVLPQIREGIQGYQDENKARLLALGMNDEMNNVQREVSWIDQRNYTQGQEYQQIISNQLYQEDEFNKYVEAELRKPNADPDLIWDKAQEFLRMNVEMVANSKLDPDIKEGLYETNLKRNLAFQKVVSDTMQKVTKERFEFNRTNMVAGLYKHLSTANGVEQMQIFTESYLEDAKRQYIDLGGYEPDQAVKLAQADLNSMLEFWKTQITDPTQQNAQLAGNLEQFLALGVQKGFLPMDTAIIAHGIASETRGNILERNNQIETQKFNDFELRMESDPSLDYNTEVRTEVARLETDYANGNISLNDMVTQTGRYMGYAARRNKALMSGSEEMTVADFMKVPRSLHQWVLDGNSVDSFVDFHERAVLSQVPDGEPVAAGLLMLQKSAQGDSVGQAIPQLATRGGKWVANAVIGTLLTSKEDLGKSEHGKAQLQRFEQVKTAYNMLRQQNPALAMSFIDGFPEEYRTIVEDAFHNNQNLASVKQAIDNPVQFELKSKNLDGAIASLTYKNLTGLWKGLTGQSMTGSWTQWSSGQKALHDQYVNLLKETVIGNKYAFVQGMGGSPSPDTLVRLMRDPNNGIILKSNKMDYSDIIIIPEARKQLQNQLGKEMGQSAMTHVANGIDARRAELIKLYNIEQEQIHVAFDKSGDVRFHIFDKNGVSRLRGTPVNGEVMTSVDVVKRARADFKSFEQQRQQRHATPNATNAGGRMGGTPVGTLFVGRDKVTWNSNAAKPFGNNREVTQAMLNYWQTQEGFVTAPTQSGVPASGGQRSVKVSGIGANLDAHPAWKARFEKARTPQEVMNVTSDFIAAHHKNLPNYAKLAGLTVPSNAPYPQRDLAGLMLVADAYWLGGDGLGKTVAQKLASSRDMKTFMQWYTSNKSLNSYDAKGNLHRRNQAMRGLIERHYSYRR